MSSSWIRGNEGRGARGRCWLYVGRSKRNFTIVKKVQQQPLWGRTGPTYSASLWIQYLCRVLGFPRWWRLSPPVFLFHLHGSDRNKRLLKVETGIRSQVKQAINSPSNTFDCCTRSATERNPRKIPANPKHQSVFESVLQKVSFFFKSHTKCVAFLKHNDQAFFNHKI